MPRTDMERVPIARHGRQAVTESDAPDMGETPPAADQPADTKDWKAETEKWKALARKHETDSKKLLALEEAQKTEAQKIAEARATAEKERDEARVALLRRDAADDAGLPRSWADRLRGTTKEELDADAKALAKDLAPKQQSAARPVPDLRSGALPASTAPVKFDGDAYIRAMARGNRQ